MPEEFGHDQIRIELKRLVEDLKFKMMRELVEVEEQAAKTQGVTAAQLDVLNEKMEESKNKASLRFQQMMDFIDRQ